MSNPPYRALRVVLGIFAVLGALGSLLLILADKRLLMRIFWNPPEAEMSTLFIVMAAELGGLGVTMSLMLFYASRDPAGNVAIIDALIVGLCVLALTPLLSLYRTEVARLYPASLIWGRSLVRLGLAAVLTYLRPRETTFLGIWRQKTGPR